MVRLRFLVPCAAAAVLAAGCGSRGNGGPDDVQPSDARAGDGPVIATLGDSITAGSPLWDPDATVRATFDAPDRDSQWQRWIDDPADPGVRNCGVWGERTDEIADRYESCTEDADAVVIQGGINDIVQGRPIEDAAHDLACMAERARRDDLRIALVEVLPWNNGDRAAAREIRELNDRIHELADRGGVPVLPFHAVLHDPRDRDRMPADRTEDGNHPNVAGYRELGERAWRTPTTATAAFARDCEDAR